jgi:hypothetical protein
MKENSLFKLVLFDIRIFLLSIVLVVANVFIYGREESTLFSVLLGLLLFFAVWFFWILVNVIVLLTTRVPVQKDERRQLMEMTSLLPEGAERALNGILILTDQHLYFKTYIFSKEKDAFSYDLKDLKKVHIKNLGFIERHQMTVDIRSGATHRFSVYSGKRWAEALRTQNVKARVEN